MANGIGMKRGLSCLSMASGGSKNFNQLLEMNITAALRSYVKNDDETIREALQFFRASGDANIVADSYEKVRADMYDCLSDLGNIGEAVQDELIQLRPSDKPPKLRNDEEFGLLDKRFSGKVKKSRTGDIVFVSGRVNGRDVNMIFPGSVFDTRTGVLT